MTLNSNEPQPSDARTFLHQAIDVITQMERQLKAANDDEMVDHIDVILKEISEQLHGLDPSELRANDRELERMQQLLGRILPLMEEKRQSLGNRISGAGRASKAASAYTKSALVIDRKNR